MLHIVVGITGASGAIYAWRFLEVLKERGIEVSIIITNPAQEIFELELSKKPADILRMAKQHYDINDFSSPLASGSYQFDAMVIVPCSMASVGAIASGNSRNLLLRTADICLKEGRPLIIVTRETPLNSIHLENLLKLSRMGAAIIPASPGFYHNPKTIQDLVDFIVGRILLRLGLKQDLFNPWGKDLS